MFCVLFVLVFPILWSLLILLVISSLDIHNVSTTSFLNLFKFSFSSLHNPLLEYISKSSVFAVIWSWRTVATWLADASPPSSAMTHSSNLTIRASSSSIVTCYWRITTSEAAWFTLSGASAAASAAFPASLIVPETLFASFFCYKVVVWLTCDFPVFL